jgi:hypothetical protein
MIYSILAICYKIKTGRQMPGGEAMTGEDICAVFKAMLPQAEIDHCAQLAVIERQRKPHLGMLVRAMVLSARTPGGTYQPDSLRSYLEFEGPRVAHSAFYRWFDDPLEQFMEASAQRAIAYPQAQQVDLAGPLWVGRRTGCT